MRCKPYVSAIFTAAIQSRLGIRARALCVLRHCSNRRRTPSSGAGRSRLFLTFIGRPPQNREPTTNDTTSLKTIHARSPKRHEDGRHMRFASHCACRRLPIEVLLAQETGGAQSASAQQGMKLVLGPHSWNCRLPADCRLRLHAGIGGHRRVEDAGPSEGGIAARPDGTLPELLESCAMIQITPQMRILVAVEPTDFRRGIDGLARVCKEVLRHDPFNGWVFVFRNRPATALKILVYDGQGFWLCLAACPTASSAGGRAGNDADFGGPRVAGSLGGRQSRGRPGGARLATSRPRQLMPMLVRGPRSCCGHENVSH